MTHLNRILVVDDDPSLRQVITAVLQEEGFDVIPAVDGMECLRLAYERQPGLILLDIMMPNRDGREVLRALREFSNVPVIMLTALSMEKEKIDRLMEGADDYVTKPFNNAELIARIRANLRRARQYEEAHQHTYDDGRLFVDFDSRQVKIGEAEIGLSPKEWCLLEYLMKHPNRAVSRGVLLRHVWGSGFEEEYNYLKVFIAHLRRKLDDSVRRPRYIHTERDLGYRFQTHN